MAVCQTRDILRWNECLLVVNEQNKKFDNIFFQVNCYNVLKERWISRQMTMILMYVSSQTVPESAIEDDGTKNKK